MKNVLSQTLYLRIIFALPALSLLVVTQIRGDIITGSSTPSPLYKVRALHFYREETSALSCLLDLRRIVPTHAVNRRSQQVVLFYSR